MWLRCNNLEIWNWVNSSHASKADVNGWKCTVLHQHYKYKCCSTLLLHAIGAQNWCALVHERAAAYCARALDKDREKDGGSKRKRDSEGVLRRYLSASDREDSPGGRSQPFSTENDTWLLWLLSSPCLPPPPNPSLQQTLRLVDAHTYTQTHSLTLYTA